MELVKIALKKHKLCYIYVTQNFAHDKILLNVINPFSI